MEKLRFNNIKKSSDPRRLNLDGRILVAHQAEFMPWLGFISKATMGDLYFILDDSQFKKEYFENRNKIRIKNGDGWQWLSVNVQSKGRIDTINNIKIVDQSWKKKHLTAVTLSYSRCKYFKTYFPEFEQIILNHDSPQLVELNVSIIKWAFEKFKISVPIFRTSELNAEGYEIDGKATDLVISMCKAANANVFVAGKSGMDYLERDKFIANNITLVFQDFHHPAYQQVHGTFVPYMSFIDLLFNEGEENAIEILGKSSYT